MRLSNQKSDKLSIKPRLWKLIDGLSEDRCRELFQELQVTAKEERRKNDRTSCAIPIGYSTREGLFKGLIKDISKGGAFIETGTELDIGEKIKMTFSSAKRPKPIGLSGHIVRKNKLGIGVSFEKTTEVFDESTWIDCRRNMVETSDDKRVDPRIDVSCAVYVEGIHKEMAITDLSAGGVFVECDSASRDKCHIGQLITLKMKLPTETDMIPAKVEIINHHERGMHCLFVDLSRKTEDAIERYFSIAKHTVPIKGR